MSSLVKPQNPGFDLPRGWEEGFHVANQAWTRAYAPYSHFQVGFALHSVDTNSFIPGANVENASYGATICAERSAVVAAIGSLGKGNYDYGVLVTDAEPPAVPCALCLQVMAELCGPSFQVIVCNLYGVVQDYTIRDLLPHSFTSIPELKSTST
ncbi:MAG: cytidine deaminase [Spirochaetales bacterium]|nr:cytidine deaminase [Spirochaetales bacterium]